MMIGDVWTFDDFNSHAHVERDVKTQQITHIQYAISTHTLTWSVTSPAILTVSSLQFQLTRSRGAWRVVGKEVEYLIGNFNSHAHVERDHIFHYMVNLINTFQLTRSRGAWQGLCKFCVVHCQISTHTLTWSVTHIYPWCDVTIKFQLTRSRGAWRKDDTVRIAGENFNSHAHVERDQNRKLSNKIKKRFQLTRSRGAWQSRSPYLSAK